jgi:hypothetical protein
MEFLLQIKPSAQVLLYERVSCEAIVLVLDASSPCGATPLLAVGR